ncbi:Hypothetical predicted protein [Cloeon dipterum]|uniref:RNA-directed DNA polymerase n=2 Tax=Cloeon dipterum TaxID=197152 RepID=A0A8S1DYQ5_9INSE|nr:Hypothetical predicted protein [Cloeon dipterum]
MVTPTPGFVVVGRVLGEDVTFLVDSGAMVSLMSLALVQELRAAIVPFQHNVGTANGAPMKVVGQVDVFIDWGKKGFYHTFVVVDVVGVTFESLIGSDFMCEHQANLITSRKVLQFPWGELPLGFNQLTQRAPLQDKAIDLKNKEVNLVTLEKIQLYEEKGPQVQIQPHRSFGKCKMAANSTMLVLVQTDSRPGAVLQVRGLNLGEGPPPPPILCLVDEAGRIPVMFANSSATELKVKGRHRQQIEVSACEPLEGVAASEVSENVRCFHCDDLSVSDYDYMLCNKCKGVLKTKENTEMDVWPAAPQPALKDDEYLELFHLEHVPAAWLEKLKQCLLNGKKAFAHGERQLGLLKGSSVRIETGQAKPIRKRPYPVPHLQRPVVEEEIRKMLNMGVIEPANSEWAAPLLLVKKKKPDGTLKYRPVIDYRGLNLVTKTSVYPYPNLQEVLDNLGGSEFFCILDMTNGFFQLQLHPESKEKTAFVSHQGVYAFTRMSYGLKNGPTEFCRAMQEAFKDLKGHGVEVFVDDFCIHAKGEVELLKLLDIVLSRAEEMGILFGPEKCQLFAREVRYLGFVVSQEGVKPDPDKVKAILEMKEPRTLKQVKGLIAMCNFYRRAIPRFSEIVLPLTDMQKGKKPKFVWRDVEQRAYKELLHALAEATLLRCPDFTQPFRLTTDASGRAVAAVLEQEISGEIFPIAFFSAKLIAAQQKYSSYQLECLAVVMAVEHFRVYLAGRPFTLFTDHYSLKWLFTAPIKSPLLGRWILALSEYEMKIVHAPGRQIQRVDFLSRPEDDHECKNTVTVGNISLEEFPSKYLDMERLREEQATEAEWGKVVAQLKEGGEQPGYFLDARGVLYRWGPHSARLCVPASFREQILSLHHDTIFGGHWKGDKMLAEVTKRYIWSNLRQDVKAHTSSCDICQRRKQGRTIKVQQQMSFATCSVGKRWYIDVVGPFPESESGNKYILTMLEAFTKFIEAAAIPDQKAKTVVQSLIEQIICRYGAIQEIVTDNGSNFKSDLFSEVCGLLGIKHSFTSPYNPRANIVEAAHKGLVDVIADFVSRPRCENWDKMIPFALLALRASKHSATGHSPALLMTGRELQLPWDKEVAPECGLDSDEIQDEHQYIKILRERLQMAQEDAHRADLWKRHLVWQQADDDEPGEELQEGDRVMIKVSNKRKLGDRWKGPFLVLGKTGRVTYNLLDPDTQRCFFYHARHLRKIGHLRPPLHGWPRQEAPAVQDVSNAGPTEQGNNNNEGTEEQHQAAGGSGQVMQQLGEQQLGGKKSRIPVPRRGRIGSDTDVRDATRGRPRLKGMDGRRNAVSADAREDPATGRVRINSRYDLRKKVKEPERFM